MTVKYSVHHPLSTGVGQYAYGELGTTRCMRSGVRGVSRTGGVFLPLSR